MCVHCGHEGSLCTVTLRGTDGSGKIACLFPNSLPPQRLKIKKALFAVGLTLLFKLPPWIILRTCQKGHSLSFSFLCRSSSRDSHSLNSSPRQHSSPNAHNKPVFIAGRIISAWFCHPADFLLILPHNLASSVVGLNDHKDLFQPKQPCYSMILFLLLLSFHPQVSWMVTGYDSSPIHKRQDY